MRHGEEFRPRPVLPLPIREVGLMKKMNFLKIAACAAALSAACCLPPLAAARRKRFRRRVVSDTSEGVKRHGQWHGNRREGRDFVHRKLPQHVES